MVLVSAKSGFSFWFQLLPQRRGWGTIGPARIPQLIPQEFSGVTEVNLLRQLIP